MIGLNVLTYVTVFIRHQAITCTDCSIIAAMEWNFCYISMKMTDLDIF